MAEIGPGNTQWEVDDNGGITCILWNDPSWRTTYMDQWSLDRHHICAKLRDAYEQGRKDQATIMKRAISFGERP